MGLDHSLKHFQKRGTGKQTDKQMNLTVWEIWLLFPLLDCVAGREDFLRSIQSRFLGQPRSGQPQSWECLRLLSTFSEPLLTALGNRNHLGMSWVFRVQVGKVTEFQLWGPKALSASSGFSKLTPSPHRSFRLLLSTPNPTTQPSPQCLQTVAP